MSSSDSTTQNTFSLFLVLLVYVAVGPLLSKTKFINLHESGICMIIGFITAICSKMLSNSPETSFSFSESSFFTLLLPPIIFNAGCSLRKQAFFQFSPYIMLLGLFSTILSFVITAAILFNINEYGLFWLSSSRGHLKFTLQEILLFSAVMSTSDSLATLSFLSKKDNPKLHSILFGEGVINNSVAIVLMKSMSSVDQTNVDLPLITVISLNLVYKIALSSVLGILVGCCCCIFLKYFRKLKPHKEQEILIIFIFAMISFNSSQHAGYSPVLSLLFSSIVISHYAYYNIDFISAQESQ